MKKTAATIALVLTCLVGIPGTAGSAPGAERPAPGRPGNGYYEGTVATGGVRAQADDALVSFSGTADARIPGITTEMSGNPEGFRVRGTATNVSTSMDGNPSGFRFTGFGSWTTTTGT